MSPEEASKSLVQDEYAKVEAQAGEHGWASRIQDLGDYYVIYVRIPKPGGRTFVLRLECDDYPRQPPLARFVDPAGWEDDPHPSDRVEHAALPVGPYMRNDRGPEPVMCIRGQRDYYAGNWHAGWTNPPSDLDTLYQLVVTVRNAIDSLQNNGSAPPSPVSKPFGR